MRNSIDQPGREESQLEIHCNEPDRSVLLTNENPEFSHSHTINGSRNGSQSSIFSADENNDLSHRMSQSESFPITSSFPAAGEDRAESKDRNGTFAVVPTEDSAQVIVTEIPADPVVHIDTTHKLCEERYGAPSCSVPFSVEGIVATVNHEVFPRNFSDLKFWGFQTNLYDG